MEGVWRQCVTHLLPISAPVLGSGTPSEILVFGLDCCQPAADARESTSRHGSRADTRAHAVQTLAGESHQQQLSRGDFINATRAQIKQRILFNLADGRAVRALHVVGVNFELRLGVDLRVVGEQQVAIGLLGVGLLRVFVDDDASVKNAVGMIVENAVVELTAAAVRAGVLDQHVVIEMLAAVADEQAIDQALSAFTGQHRMHVVAHQSSAEKHRVRRNVRASFPAEFAGWKY